MGQPPGESYQMFIPSYAELLRKDMHSFMQFVIDKYLNLTDWTAKHQHITFWVAVALIFLALSV